MKRKLVACALSVSLALSLSVSNISFAEGSNSKLQQKKEDLQEIRENKKEKQEELNQTSEEKDELEKQIEQIEKELTEFDKKMEEQGQQLVKQKRALGEKEKKFQSTIRRLYQQGEFGYMAQLLSARSFGEFLKRFESLRLLIKQDNTVIKSYRQDVEKIQKLQDQLEKLKKERQPKLEEAQKKMEALNDRLKSLSSEVRQLEKKEELTEEELNEIKSLISSGTGSYSGRFHFPSTPGRVYWNFGEWRGSYAHKGIDIPRPVGTPIYAAASGTVVKAGPSSGFGYLIIVDHGNGLATWYGHMYASGVYVSPGQKVRAGQTIGAVGNNGQSTGPHLHFEVRKNNTPVNPANYLR
ncbi:murein hydrolase activator EnvC family protein [Thermoflavimicrobium dichotomicum]|uniref:Septal ring factor EnvC, activator of murein hydrolases AmiA and AmiB n=1 Tax=Thermoflavimicrobium dichotomicum TaxID=46223 RepID=A0A1I3JVV5_9BACL|nr:peptidoglycan DD-metalloendopeptidase family protein [Thermoflavimicrobium dichotomicum]SFI64085.1 Septal ring factor EnvC, activator of murein hydrolases AmiA and AmiB [Thermoflavimicrobium dichotomicum]